MKPHTPNYERLYSYCMLAGRLDGRVIDGIKFKAFPDYPYAERLPEQQVEYEFGYKFNAGVGLCASVTGEFGYWTKNGNHHFRTTYLALDLYTMKDNMVDENNRAFCYVHHEISVQEPNLIHSLETLVRRTKRAVNRTQEQEVKNFYRRRYQPASRFRAIKFQIVMEEGAPPDETD